MFTRKTVALKEWASKWSNIKIDEETINEPAYALLMSVSSQVGIDHWKVFKKSVNIPKFI